MSENLNREIRDFSKYDSMETEELEEILRLDAEAPEDHESDIELLFYVMGVLADRNRNTNITGNNAQEAWESFQQNYMPKECLEFKPKKTSPWLRRLISAAAVLALIICIPVTANAFSWKDAWDIIARWAKETFSFVSSEDTEVNEPSPDENVEYVSFAQLLQKHNIPTNLVPTWVPDGFILERIEKDITPTQEIYRAYYTNGDKVLRLRVQTYLSDVIQNTEIDDSYSEIYAVSNVDYYIFENLDQVQAIWINDIYECIISGDFSIDEVKMMIDSIEKG